MRAGGSVWPEGAPYALCLTHDVDRVRKRLYHYLYYGARGGVRGLSTQLGSLRRRIVGDEPYWNFARIMELEESLGVRSTFLFLNERARGFAPKFWGRYDICAREVQDVIRTLDAGGWEVGLHGSYFSHDDAVLLRNEKDILEDILGKRIRSTRQHYLNLSEPWTWQIQWEVGLEVDSTVSYAGRAWDENEGIFPYHPEGSRVLELPITVMDTIGLHELETRVQVEALITKVAEAGGLIVLNWHQRTYAPGEYTEAVDFYVSTIRRAKAEDGWIASMGEIADHWNARARAR